jgi:hypothetical protein
MAYFINISGEPKGPYDLSEIRDSIEEGEIDGDTLICPTEGETSWVPIAELLGDEVPVSRLPPPSPPAPAAAVEQPAAEADEDAAEPVTAHEYLRYVRANTCYSGLRAMVEVIFSLVLLTGLVGAGVFAALPYLTSNRVDLVQIGLAAAAFAALVVLAIPARMVAHLVIDLADARLHRQSLFFEK